MSAGNIFIVYPGQVHLMNRQSAQGLVVQFRKNIFEHLHPLKHHNFYRQSPGFSCDVATFNHLHDLCSRIGLALQQQATPLSVQKACSYLHVVLVSLLELQSQAADNWASMALAQYISLITENIRQKKKVSEYAELMSTT